ncbi:uncharacterized protein LOC128553532 [Mercenaria mercenaria]|uniref:uncharacterized protein LOC128553532 n=1 Tax=Mercenaria mercenaria TaxID=6596 RepID=UPI00234F2B1A|nr:uncharacterized protein LOC128553532 [Mercenaria mercenaria]
MFQQHAYIENVSLRLSEVLADIGVNERIILKKRRTWLLAESMGSIHTRSTQLRNVNCSVYFLGSQSEGSTTLGLDSDIDCLLCYNKINVIQDWADWEPGVRNHLIIQDDTLSPGYCLLQTLCVDVPLPYNNVPNPYLFRNSMGKILMKNSFMSVLTAPITEGGIRHGPALAWQGQPGVYAHDIVFAFHCKSWPLQARQWLFQQGVGQWPSDHMKRYCSNTGCFVVGVGNKSSDHEEVEWRISTSLAERCLMFNLSITQIRCYILMKMILKTFIKPHFEDTISSYMCKTVLFRCIANTESNVWRENNLLACLSLCIFTLYNNTFNENCPHFIIPGNNLMRGHISRETKPYILEILLVIINSGGRALLGIECDALGDRIQMKMSYFLSVKISDIISGHLLLTTVKNALHIVQKELCILTRNRGYEEAIRQLLRDIIKLVIISNQCQGLDKTACSLMTPWFCTTLGSILASQSIHQCNAISADALTWISLGLNTDVASSKLKLASMLYCLGDTQRTEIILRDIEANYDLNNVEPACVCYGFICQPYRRGFNEICDNHNEEAVQYTAASCVRFLQCEINCVPHELRYEVFRSTQEDLAFRGTNDDWMDLAVTDSLPYLYFLQYKTYTNLGRHEDKHRALSNLMRTIDQEPNLAHRETALNILGQCMEQEDQARDALRCYSLSLNVRERNNAANIHICRLLSNIICNHYLDGKMFRFTVGYQLTDWQKLEKEIVTGCTVSVVLFIMGMNLPIYAAQRNTHGPKTES